MTKRNSTYQIDPTQKRGRPRQHALTEFEKNATLKNTEPGINKPTGFASLFWDGSIYIDGEWHFNTNPQKFYLLGYAFNDRYWGWLYNQNDYTFGDKVLYTPKEKGKDRLNRTWLLRLFEDVKTIYFYGPDAGQIERMFHIKLKDKYRCVNLLTVVKKIVPKEDMWRATQKLMQEGVIETHYTPEKPCYRLCVVEELVGIHRSTLEYKKDVDNLHRDWYSPKLRAKALLYNKEDVLNLIKVKERLYRRYYIPRNIEDQCTLAVTEADKTKFKTRK